MRVMTPFVVMPMSVMSMVAPPAHMLHMWGGLDLAGIESHGQVLGRAVHPRVLEPAIGVLVDVAAVHDALAALGVGRLVGDVDVLLTAVLLVGAGMFLEHVAHRAAGHQGLP